MLIVQTLLDIQKRLRKGDYYKNHSHCVRGLPLVQDYNEQLLDYLVLGKNRRNDLEFVNHFQTFH